MKNFFYLFFLLFSPVVLAAVPSSLADNIPEPPVDSRQKLDELAKGTALGSDYFKLKLAEKKIKLDDLAQAKIWVSRVGDPIFAFWKNVVEAEIFVLQDKPREAIATLKNFPPAPDYEISFGEGIYDNIYKRGLIARMMAKKKLGDKPNWEIGQLLALYDSDEKVKSLLDATELTTPFTAQQKITRLHNLHARYRFKDVPGLLTVTEIKSAKLVHEDTCQALYELGNSLRYNQGQADASSVAFNALLNGNCGDDYTARALYWLGSLGGTEDEATNKSTYYTKLYKEFPNHRLSDDALYKLYQLSKKAGDSSKAEKYFDQLMSLKRGDMKGVLAFELGYPLYEDGKFKQAAHIFEKALETEATADESLPRAMYWHARSLQKIGGKANEAKAKLGYQKLVNTCPQSFYAILAAKRIGASLKSPTLSDLKGSAPSSGSDYFALIDNYNRLGYHNAAKTVMDLGIHVHPEWEKQNKEYLAAKLIESQNYRKALDIAAKHFESGVYGPVADLNASPLIAAFFPLAFQKNAKQGYEMSSLPKGAIEGIMREESLFQTTVKSRVGATGLMQLMPTTAAMLRRNNAQVAFAEDLTDPQSNIALGATYLSDMKSYFNGQLPLAIMAYNAGPGNVNKWLRSNGNLELDEFIEKIPLSETRDYVKRVMRSMQIYGMLYKEPYFVKNQEFSFDIKSSKSAKN